MTATRPPLPPHTLSHLTNEQLDWCWRLWDALERHGEDHFDLSRWARNRRVSDWSLRPLFEAAGTGVINVAECGTTACIAGHMVFLLDAAEREQLSIGLDARPFGMDSDTFLRNELATMLGMDVNRPSNFSVSDWFLGTWPAWAHELMTARYAKLLSAGADHNDASRRAEFFVVRMVADDIVHGRRFDWWTPLEGEVGHEVIEYSYFGDDD